MPNDLVIVGTTPVAAPARQAPTRRPGRARDAEELALLRLAVATSAALDATTDEARAAVLEAGGRLVALAEAGDDAALGEVLRPDPARAAATYTVACYQIGDLSPSALRDFPDPIEAVRLLSGCDDASHVAAELIVSTDDGLRWNAAVRTARDVRFVLPPTADGLPSEVAQRWDDRLVSWAVDPDQLPLPEPVVSGPVVSGPVVPGSLAAGPLVDEPGVATSDAVLTVATATTGALEAHVAHLLRRIDALEAELATQRSGGRWQQIGRQVDVVVDIWRRTKR